MNFFFAQKSLVPSGNDKYSILKWLYLMYNIGILYIKFILWSEWITLFAWIKCFLVIFELWIVSNDDACFVVQR